jgi:hypothetical protein
MAGYEGTLALYIMAFGDYGGVRRARPSDRPWAGRGLLPPPFKRCYMIIQRLCFYWITKFKHGWMTRYQPGV